MMFWRFLPRYVSDPKHFKLSTINAKERNPALEQCLERFFLKAPLPGSR